MNLYIVLGYPLQVEQEKAALRNSLQESQTQLRHTEGALTEQHEKGLRLSQRVTALRRLYREGTPLNQEALSELERDEDELDASEDLRPGTLNTQVFSYQTPGLEILQCKYRVAVNELVELKAELRWVKDKLAQCEDGSAEEKQKGDSQLQRLDRQLIALEKSCQDGQEKVPFIFNIKFNLIIVH